MTERFDARFVGSTYGPLTVAITSGGQPYDLTGSTATITIDPVRGGAAIVTAFDHTNTPGALGTFEFQLEAGHVAVAGEYRCTVTCTIGGETLVLVYRHQIRAPASVSA